MQGLVGGPHRHRRDVHAAEPARPQGRTAVRGAADPGFDRPERARRSRSPVTSMSTGARNSTPATAWSSRVLGPSLTANIGWLGLQHVLENGGSGFFARRIVEPLLKTRSGCMWSPTPPNSRCGYVAYPMERDGRAGGGGRRYHAPRGRRTGAGAESRTPPPNRRAQPALIAR